MSRRSLLLTSETSNDVWSAKLNSYRIFLIKLPIWAGWSESLLVSGHTYHIVGNPMSRLIIIRNIPNLYTVRPVSLSSLTYISDIHTCPSLHTGTGKTYRLPYSNIYDQSPSLSIFATSKIYLVTKKIYWLKWKSTWFLLENHKGYIPFDISHVIGKVVKMQSGP